MKTFVHCLIGLFEKTLLTELMDDMMEADASPVYFDSNMADDPQDGYDGRVCRDWYEALCRLRKPPVTVHSLQKDKKISKLKAELRTTEDYSNALEKELQATRDDVAIFKSKNQNLEMKVSLSRLIHLDHGLQ